MPIATSSQEQVYSISGEFGPHNSLAYKFKYEQDGQYSFQIQLNDPSSYSTEFLSQLLGAIGIKPDSLAGTKYIDSGNHRVVIAGSCEPLSATAGQLAFNITAKGTEIAKFAVNNVNGIPDVSQIMPPYFTPRDIRFMDNTHKPLDTAPTEAPVAFTHDHYADLTTALTDAEWKAIDPATPGLAFDIVYDDRKLNTIRRDREQALKNPELLKQALRALVMQYQKNGITSANVASSSFWTPEMLEIAQEVAEEYEGTGFKLGLVLALDRHDYETKNLDYIEKRAAVLLGAKHVVGLSVVGEDSLALDMQESLLTAVANAVKGAEKELFYNIGDRKYVPGLMEKFLTKLQKDVKSVNVTVLGGLSDLNIKLAKDTADAMAGDGGKLSFSVDPGISADFGLITPSDCVAKIKGLHEAGVSVAVDQRGSGITGYNFAGTRDVTENLAPEISQARPNTNPEGYNISPERIEAFDSNQNVERNGNQVTYEEAERIDQEKLYREIKEKYPRAKFGGLPTDRSGVPKQLIVLTGGSLNNGIQYPLPENATPEDRYIYEYYRLQAQIMIRSLDPEKVAFAHGGTKVGFEGIFLEVLEEERARQGGKKFDDVSFRPTSELGSTDKNLFTNSTHVILTGKTYDSLPHAIIEFSKQAKMAIISAGGGGGVVKNIINMAIEAGDIPLAISSGPTPEELATEHPSIKKIALGGAAILKDQPGLMQRVGYTTPLDLLTKLTEIAPGGLDSAFNENEARKLIAREMAKLTVFKDREHDPVEVRRASLQGDVQTAYREQMAHAILQYYQHVMMYEYEQQMYKLPNGKIDKAYKQGSYFNYANFEKATPFDVVAIQDADCPLGLVYKDRAQAVKAISFISKLLNNDHLLMNTPEPDSRGNFIVRTNLQQSELSYLCTIADSLLVKEACYHPKTTNIRRAESARKNAAQSSYPELMQPEKQPYAAAGGFQLAYMKAECREALKNTTPQIAGEDRHPAWLKYSNVKLERCEGENNLYLYGCSIERQRELSAYGPDANNRDGIKGNRVFGPVAGAVKRALGLKDSNDVTGTINTAKLAGFLAGFIPLDGLVNRISNQIPALGIMADPLKWLANKGAAAIDVAVRKVTGIMPHVAEGRVVNATKNYDGLKPGVFNKSKLEVAVPRHRILSEHLGLTPTQALAV